MQQKHQAVQRSDRSDITHLLEAADSVDELRTVEFNEEEDSGTHRLSDDQIYEIVYNRRRRWIIRYLLDGDGTATVSDLAEHIAARENEISIRELSSNERKRVYVGLYQSHLPMLDEMGVIEYNKNRGTLSKTESLNELEPYIDASLGRQFRWPLQLGGVTLAMLVSIGLLASVGFQIGLTSVIVTVGSVGLAGLLTVDAIDRIRSVE